MFQGDRNGWIGRAKSFEAEYQKSTSETNCLEVRSKAKRCL